ncbi:MAG: monovalent cation/H+ antiporter subunit D family protein [Deltaproteobacteria bacterium]|nr:monovalent cation/H+ antiporter subunit D family protein [Deltaproteobacteria bacterium]
MTPHHLPILIVVIHLISSFIVPLLGWWRREAAFFIALAAVAGSFVCSAGVLAAVLHQGTIHYRLGGWEPPWGIELVIDHLNAYMAVLVSSISLVVAIYSRKSVEHEIPERFVHFYCIFLLLATGLLGMVVTGDMFNLYVFLEIASISAYALIAVGEDGAPMASFNYIILGTIGASFYLLGVGYLYIMTGSLNMADLSRLLPDLYNSTVIRVAFAFFVIGLGLKIALFPLHVWLPDAYTYAPSAVSAFIAPLMTKVGAYALIRIMFTVYEPRFSFELLPFASILSVMAAVAIIVGSVLAIAQSDLKRMLAYSSVSQIGYIVLGVALGNRPAIIGAYLHILNHALMKGCLFMVAGSLMLRVGMRDIFRLQGVHRTMPWTMGAFVIAALSMIGIPPTAGFFSKWYLILGTIQERQWVMTAVILVSSLLNAVYFFRVIENAYFEPRYAHDGGDPQADVNNGEAPAGMLLPTLIMAAAIILVGLASGKIIEGVLQFAVPGNF